MRRSAAGVLVAASLLLCSGCFIGRGRTGRPAAHVGNGLLMALGVAMIAGGEAEGKVFGTLLMTSSLGGMLITAGDTSGNQKTDETAGKLPREGLDEDAREDRLRRGDAQTRARLGVRPGACDHWEVAVAQQPDAELRARLVARMPPDCRSARARRAMAVAPSGPAVPAPPPSLPGSKTLTRAQCDGLWRTIDAELDLDQRARLEASVPPECR